MKAHFIFRKTMYFIRLPLPVECQVALSFGLLRLNLEMIFIRYTIGPRYPRFHLMAAQFSSFVIGLDIPGFVIRGTPHLRSYSNY